MKKIFLLFTIVLLASHDGIAQKPLSDSLIYFLQKIKGNEKSDSIWIRKAFYDSNFPKDSAGILQREKLIDKLKPLLKEEFYIAFKIKIADELTLVSANYTSIDKFKAIIEKYKDHKNAYQYYLLQIALSGARFSFRNSDRIYEGIPYYLNLADYFTDRKDSQAISLCYYTLSGFYSVLGLNDKCIYYRQKSLSYLKEENSSFDYPLNFGTSIVGNIGILNRNAIMASSYTDNDEPQKAIPLLNKCIELYEKHKKNLSISDGPFFFLEKAKAYMTINMDSVPTYLNLAKTIISDSDMVFACSYYQLSGEYYYEKEMLDSAMMYIRKCDSTKKVYALNTNTFGGVIIPEYYYALISIKKKLYPEAILNLQKGIALLKAGNLRKESLLLLKTLAETFEAKYDFKNAMLTWKSYQILQDELQNDISKSRNISFEIEQQMADKANALHELEDENAKNQKSKYYLIGISLVLMLIALGLFNRYRLKQKANQDLAEKNQIISKEKQRSDELLLNILPEEVAEELKQTGASLARQYNHVSVLFTDFVNFTGISETMSPTELVAEIHTCFKAFDEIVERNGLEKIKTIGDAYLAVCGLPIEDEQHAIKVAKAAIEILLWLQNQNSPFQIRIGLNSGPVVAGIVGVKKFAYDIWGDTVNTAARMEQNSEPGKINVSGQTYALIKHKFNLVHRGKIDAKNKGEIDMYFLET